MKSLIVKIALFVIGNIFLIAVVSKSQTIDYGADNIYSGERICKELEFSRIPESQNVSSIKLKQNYPNPFTEVTIIEFTLNEESVVKMDVVDEKGNVLETLINSEISDGTHNVYYKPAKNVDTGNLKCRMETYTSDRTRRLNSAEIVMYYIYGRDLVKRK